MQNSNWRRNRGTPNLTIGIFNSVGMHTVSMFNLGTLDHAVAVPNVSAVPSVAAVPRVSAVPCL